MKLSEKLAVIEGVDVEAPEPAPTSRRRTPLAAKPTPKKRTRRPTARDRGAARGQRAPVIRPELRRRLLERRRHRRRRREPAVRQLRERRRDHSLHPRRQPRPERPGRRRRVLQVLPHQIEQRLAAERHAAGHRLDLVDDGVAPWSLLALTGGHPADVFGELEGGRFRPLSVAVDGRLVAL